MESIGDQGKVLDDAPEVRAEMVMDRSVHPVNYLGCSYSKSHCGNITRKAKDSPGSSIPSGTKKNWKDFLRILNDHGEKFCIILSNVYLKQSQKAE